MIMLGGITRLTNSGLSMTSWKFNGSLPPMNHYEWQQEFQQYRDSPEFKLINNDFSLEDFQSIYWWEYIHRLTGRLIGITYLFPFIIFLLRRKLSRNFILPLITGFALIVFQGILGWIMVKSGLKDKPHVNHFLLAAHLALASGTLLYIFSILLRLKSVYEPTVIPKRLISFSRAVFVLVFIQLILGALVAGLKAGKIYGTFPKMGDHWMAPEVFSSSIGFITNGAAFQFIHRVMALLILVLVIIQYWQFRKTSLPRELNFTLRSMPFFVIVQATLGVLCLLMKVPVNLGVAHQVCGILLLGVAFYIQYRAVQYSNTAYRVKQQAQAYTPASNNHD